VPLEARLGERLARGAQPVSVPAAVVVPDAPRDLDRAARDPLGAQRLRSGRQRRPECALAREARVEKDRLPTERLVGSHGAPGGVPWRAWWGPMERLAGSHGGPGGSHGAPGGVPWRAWWVPWSAW